MKLEVTCPACATVHSFDDVVPFRAECDKCAADLHVCISCRFYDRYADNECREDQADPVQVKDRRNLCEYWKPLAIGDDAIDDVARAKARLAAAFGLPQPSHASPGASSSTAADDARRKLEALFNKK